MITERTRKEQILYEKKVSLLAIADAFKAAVVKAVDVESMLLSLLTLSLLTALSLKISKCHH